MIWYNAHCIRCSSRCQSTIFFSPFPLLAQETARGAVSLYSLGGPLVKKVIHKRGSVSFLKASISFVLSHCQCCHLFPLRIYFTVQNSKFWSSSGSYHTLSCSYVSHGSCFALSPWYFSRSYSSLHYCPINSSISNFVPSSSVLLLFVTPEFVPVTLCDANIWGDIFRVPVRTNTSCFANHSVPLQRNRGVDCVRNIVKNGVVPTWQLLWQDKTFFNIL
jgi:hypothetical protein